MFDRIFSAALAFCVLGGATMAIGSAMLEQPASQPQVVQLPRVEVIGKRAPAEPTLAQAESASKTKVQ